MFKKNKCLLGLLKGELRSMFQPKIVEITHRASHRPCPISCITRFDGAYGNIGHTGCSLNIVFFSEFSKIFLTLFSLGVSVCTHTRQVENQPCSELAEFRKITTF